MYKNILITGGAGYIGSNVVHEFLNKKFKVFVIDNLITGSKKLIDKRAIFINEDIQNIKSIKNILIKKKINTIIHLAALINVQDSEKKKYIYFKNNVLGTKNLLNSCRNTFVKNIIFSSSAGVYGDAKGPIKESTKIKPINFYSITKFKGENLIKKFSKKYNLKYCILRYFNVCGASKNKKFGILNKNNKSLFKVISSQIYKKKPKIKIFGKNFPTTDGTCIRDFIHVADLASIHYKTFKFLITKKKSQIFNCGYGKGHSVLQVVNKFQEISKKKINIVFKTKREGEIINSFSDNSKLKRLINWHPEFNNLDEMVKSSLNWEKKCHN